MDPVFQTRLASRLPPARFGVQRVLPPTFVAGIRRHDDYGNGTGVSSPGRFRRPAQPALGYPVRVDSTSGIARDQGSSVGGAGIYAPRWTSTTSASLAGMDPGFTRVLRGIRAKDGSARRLARATHGETFPGLRRSVFMAMGQCPIGEEWGRGGVAQTGGRDLCPALRAGEIPVLLLLSLRGG